MAATPKRRLVIFSGGTAANSLVDVFNRVAEANTCAVSYVIPISDNGGSSSELMRVFGGPGIGDIRSRLVRLIAPSHAHILRLLNYRLPPQADIAYAEFLTLLSGTSDLYNDIESAQAMLIRSVLSHLHLEIMKRNRPPSSMFNFQSASVGNLFLTGARLFSGSVESAIYLFALMGGVNENKTAVLPAIVSNFSHHIAAGLADGTVIVGQNSISHPGVLTALNQTSEMLSESHLDFEDANPPGTMQSLRQPAISFSKSTEEVLPAPITRIWYINPYGQEMRPKPNAKALAAVEGADAIIYSIGSLYTSIIPSLILDGIGPAIARSDGARFKILILNGSLDRETGGYNATDFVSAIVDACTHKPQSSLEPGDSNSCSAYVTHVIYMEADKCPLVNRNILSAMGIECVRLYGRRGSDDISRYDDNALAQTLSAILGKREKSARSRRNTLEG